MRGHEQVVTLLNDVLTAELTAINQYFIHGRMCENWGSERLWKKIREETVPEQLRLDLELERDAIRLLNAGIETARSLGDNGTRELLEHLLEGEEHHANWIEAQMTLIAQTGEGNYLAQQIKDGE